jgi:hypothetical protein
MLLPKKEPHTLQLSIKLWQPVQPEQTKKTNQKTACNPKNETPEVVVLSNQTQQQLNKKQTTHTNNNKPPQHPQKTTTSQSGESLLRKKSGY